MHFLWHFILSAKEHDRDESSTGAQGRRSGASGIAGRSLAEGDVRVPDERGTLASAAGRHDPRDAREPGPDPSDDGGGRPHRDRAVLARTARGDPRRLTGNFRRHFGAAFAFATNR